MSRSSAPKLTSMHGACSMRQGSGQSADRLRSGCPMAGARRVPRAPDAIIRRNPPGGRNPMGLLPREGKFFDFFNEHADLAALAALELQALFKDISQLDRHS